MNLNKDNINSKESGITLIALIITIITLSILASVTISIAFREQGIIKQTKEAKLTQQEETDIQEITIAVSVEDLEVAMNGGTRERNNIAGELEKKYGDKVVVDWTNELDVFLVTLDGNRYYKVDKYGVVKKLENLNSVVISDTKPTTGVTETVTPVPTILATPTPTVTPAPTSSVTHIHTASCYHHCYDTNGECYSEEIYDCPDCEDGEYIVSGVDINWHEDECTAGTDCPMWAEGICPECGSIVYRDRVPYYCTHTCTKCANGFLIQSVNDCKYGGDGTLQCGY